MKATVIAPSNIAFIKYWGKRDEKFRLPLNSSLSMNLSGAYTTTTVEFSHAWKKDDVEFIDDSFSQREIDRIRNHLNLIRQKASITLFAKVATKNNFPKNSGVASSASGYAALTVAAVAAAGLKLSEKELTILARIGSGSACRSIPDGFVEWKSGESSGDSYARSLFPVEYWDLCDIIAIVSQQQKEVSSTAGQERVQTSPFWKERVLGIPQKLALAKRALKEKNLRDLGIIIEEDCVNMHAVMMTQNPPLFYWNAVTASLIHAVRNWRKEGLPVYFTIDAGPNVHLFCESKDEIRVLDVLQSFEGIQSVIVNKPAQGTRLMSRHLF